MSRHSTRPRVMVLGPLPPPYGGPETMTVVLVTALEQRSELVIEHIDTQVSRSLAEKGGRHQLRKSIPGLRQALILIARLLTFWPHLVYLPVTNSPSFLGFLRDATLIVPALLFRRRVAVRLNGGYYFYAHMHGWRRWVVRTIMGRVVLAMVEGERLTDAFNGVIPRNRIVTIPNGIDDEPFTAALAIDGRQARKDQKRVLFVGLLCEAKGVEDVLKAMPFVPDAEFVFLGEWASEQFAHRVRRFLVAHSLTNRASFPGVLTGPAMYRGFVSSDVFVFPSYLIYEGHAVVSVLALAAGLPIVCTDHGALNESVKDGWNGYFVQPHDPVAIAARLNAILEDDILRATMAERSRQLYTERFTKERFIDSWVESVVRCATRKQEARS